MGAYGRDEQLVALCFVLVGIAKLVLVVDQRIAVRSCVRWIYV